MKEQLLATVENSKNYTLQVADAMPEKGYADKPAGAGWNFGELLHHIAYGIQWWQDNYITGTKTSWDPPPAKNKKQDLIADLTRAYDTLQKTIKQQPPSEQSVNGVHATLDHITHHRGQAVLYLRTNGVEPPEYVY
ncbi:MAG TPA: DinB family protein [Niastella sp.]